MLVKTRKQLEGKGGIISTSRQPCPAQPVFIRIKQISREKCKEKDVVSERVLLNERYPRKGITMQLMILWSYANKPVQSDSQLTKINNIQSPATTLKQILSIKAKWLYFKNESCIVNPKRDHPLMHSLTKLKKRYKPMSIASKIDNFTEDKSLLEEIRQRIIQKTIQNAMRHNDLIQVLAPILLQNMLQRKKVMTEVILAETINGFNELTFDLQYIPSWTAIGIRFTRIPTKASFSVN